MEKLGLGDARQILAMLNGEEIASSKLSPRLTALLRQEGLLLLKNNGSRCKYRIAEAMRESCRTLLSQEFGLKCTLEEWISASSSMQTRADMVRMVGDSKAKKVNTFRGFLVDSYVLIDAMLNGKPFILHPMEGSSVYQSAGSFRDTGKCDSCGYGECREFHADSVAALAFRCPVSW